MKTRSTLPVRSQALAAVSLGFAASFGIPSVLAASLAHAPDFQLSATLVGEKLEVRATPPTAAFHINIKAPMFLEPAHSQAKLKPTHADEKSVQFTLAPAEAAQFLVSLYVCDNSNTICERHDVKASWSSQSSGDGKPSLKLLTAAGEAGAASKAASQEKGTEKTEKKDEHGFLVNAAEEAFARAAAQKKPLLIDFYGIWCPPCNQLDEEVFPSPQFSQQTKDFVKLKMDVDDPVSWKLKSRYRIGGYPTIIFAAPNGEEISRLVGFRPLPAFLAEVKKAWSHRKEPLSVLQAKADHGDRAAADRLGLIYLERKETVQAIKYLHATKVEQEALGSAEIQFVSDLKPGAGQSEEAVQEKVAATLERVISQFPHSPDSLERRTTLADLIEKKDAARAKSLRLEAAKEARALASGPASKYKGYDYSAADLWQSAADAFERVGQEAEAKEAWKQAIAEYRKRIGSKQEERGFQLELAYCLWKSGQAAEAEAIYQRLEKAYPTEFTFYFGHARMNYALKRFQEAMVSAQKALQFSYGDNRLRAADLVAKIQQQQGKKTDALATVKKALAEAQIPEDSTIRTHGYVKNLKDLETKLQ